MGNTKNAIIKKKIEGVEYDLHVKTSAEQVVYEDTTVKRKLDDVLSMIGDSVTKEYIDNEVSVLNEKIGNQGDEDTDTDATGLYKYIEEQIANVEVEGGGIKSISVNTTQVMPDENGNIDLTINEYDDTGLSQRVDNLENSVKDIQTFDNKEVLDTITEEKITEWDNKSEFDGSYNSLADVPENLTNEEDVKRLIAEAQLAGGDIDFSELQYKEDINLTTNDKTVVGAINELDAEIGEKGVQGIPTVEEAYIYCLETDEGALVVVANDTIDIDATTQITVNDANQYGGLFVEGDYVKYQAHVEGNPGIPSTGLYGYVDDILANAGALKGDKGDPGIDGQPGADGFSPTVVENADNTDEVYKLDITNETGSYTTPNLVGKPGSQGIQGPAGATGEKGDTGATGEDGVSPVIVENADNSDDIYKIDITTADGTFTTPNLVGRQGVQGIQGEKGDPGEQGVQGIQGIQGVPGERGADGYPFLIYKEYSSLDEFDASDFPEIGLMFMVKTEGADSQPVYRYTGEADTPYSHITDMATTEGLKGDKGDTGPQGEQGVPGVQGEPGKDGITYTPVVGTVTTVDATQGAEVDVVVDEPSQSATFNFRIPRGAVGQQGLTGKTGEKGDTGDAGKDGTTYTPSIGTVRTVTSDVPANATVNIDEDTKTANFSFDIPQGEKGEDGVQIDDTTTATDKVWSSSKVDSEKLSYVYDVDMVELGFARDEVVDLADFLATLIARYGKSAFIHFHWGNALSASVTDGTNTVRINGGFLLLSVSGNFPNLAWGMATAIYCSGAHYEGGTSTIWKFVETVESTAGTIASKNIYRYSGQTTEDVDWTTLAIRTDNFSLYNLDSANSTVKYRKTGNIVEVLGVVKPASDTNVLNTATETTICTLPTGCRPTQSIFHLCQGTVTSTWLLTITSTGSVLASRYRSGANGAAFDDTPPSTTTWMPFHITFTV